MDYINIDNIELDRNLKEKLRALISYTPEVLTMKEQLGNAYNFEFLKNEFESIHKIILELSELKLSVLPIKKQQMLLTLLNHVMIYFRSIVDFQPTKSGENYREEIINKTNNYLYKLSNFFSEIYPVYQLLAIDDPIKNSFQKKILEIDELIKGIKSNNQKADEDVIKINQILNSAEDTSKKIGVSKYGKIFDDESKLNNKYSRYWLITSVSTLALIIGLSFYLYHELTTNDINSTEQLIQFSIFKISIIFALIYFLSICRTSYKAQKHNSVVNKHRHNALVTFKTFTDGTEDEGTKNAVLLEATRTIFSNQTTGYLKEDKDSDNSNKIIEIFKHTK